MSSHIGLFNHAIPVIVMGNLQLCLVVDYGENRCGKMMDLLYPRKKKLPILYYSIRVARCEKGQFYSYYCMTVSGVNKVPYSERL